MPGGSESLDRKREGEFADRVAALLPEPRAQNPELRDKAKIPDDVGFRSGLSQLGLSYVVGVQPTLSVWQPGEEPLPPKARSGTGRPPSLMRRSSAHGPLSAKALPQELSADAWRSVTWREGSNIDLASRFDAVRVRPASRDYNLTQPRAEEWLLIEWPMGRRAALILTFHASGRQAAQRSRGHGEAALAHRYEGRGWRGFHHHASLCIAAYGFLISEREAIPPSAPARPKDSQESAVSRSSRSRTSTHTARAARPKLDLHHTPSDRRRARLQLASMSLPRQGQSSSSTSFMTQ